MKKIIKMLLIICVVFSIKTVNADTYMRVGETTNIFKNSSCKITSCSSTSDAVSLTFDEASCSATGEKKGAAKIEITCDGEVEKKNININVLDANATINTGDNYDSTLYDNVVSAEVNCSTLGSLRGDLQGIFNVFKIVAPILVIAMSVYDFIKAFTGKVEGEMKKAFTKLVKRLIFAVILFFLPNILDFFLGLVDPGYTTCINN